MAAAAGMWREEEELVGSSAGELAEGAGEGASISMGSLPGAGGEEISSLPVGVGAGGELVVVGGGACGAGADLVVVGAVAGAVEGASPAMAPTATMKTTIAMNKARAMLFI